MEASSAAVANDVVLLLNNLTTLRFILPEPGRQIGALTPKQEIGQHYSLPALAIRYVANLFMEF